MNTIALVGSGNVFFKDEGAGLYAAKYLKENYRFSPAIEIVDGGTLGFGLMPMLREFGHIVIANTASGGAAAPGTVTVRDADTFLNEPTIKQTANEVEIAEMARIGALSGEMAELTLVSIVPDDLISVEVGMSPAMVAAWPVYIEMILGALREGGIESVACDHAMPLEMIFDTFANPSVEHGRGF